MRRHRELWLLLSRRLGLLERSWSVMHFAPEAILQKRLRELPNVDYVSADLDSPQAMAHFDITNIPYPDESFDLVLCSHVLEHVPADRTAMKEILRLLRPGGMAIISVPIDYDRDATYEDSSIVDPEERQRIFGQHDHVRIYGPDFPARLREAGFAVEADRLARELEERGDPDFVRYGLSGHENIFVCRRAEPARQREG